jgi:hypothetical protein
MTASPLIISVHQCPIAILSTESDLQKLPCFHRTFQQGSNVTRAIPGIADATAKCAISIAPGNIPCSSKCADIKLFATFDFPSRGSESTDLEQPPKERFICLRSKIAYGVRLADHPTRTGPRLAGIHGVAEPLVAIVFPNTRNALSARARVLEIWSRVNALDHPYLAPVLLCARQKQTRGLIVLTPFFANGSLKTYLDATSASSQNSEGVVDSLQSASTEKVETFSTRETEHSRLPSFERHSNGVCRAISGAT